MPKIRETVDGWLFECPGCGNIHKFDERWTFNNDLDKPTFRPSLLVNGNMQYHNSATPRCHSFVTNGKIKFLGDCTHELAGQTVELEEI